ncbi:MAG: hypothetical protein RLY86_1023 [Pseudomonadota bacterium]|jgi:tetratricopeptide (TPR) repeat protein
MSAGPDRHADLLAKGAALQDEGRLDDAEATFRQILAEKPDHAEGLHALGVLALVRNDPESAVTHLAWSLRHRHANAAAFSNLCAALRQLGRLDQARIAGREAVALDPDFAPGLHNLACVLFDLKEPAAAVDPLRRYVALVPGCTEQRFQLAIALMAGRRHAEAETAWHDLCRMTPDDGRAWANLGVVLKNQGRYAEAVAAYRRGLALMPDEAGILNNLGLALSLMDGREGEAIAWLERAVALRPSFADAWLNLGLVLRNLNRIDGAIAHCRRALAADPDLAAAHTLLGTCLLLKGEMAAGFAAYEWRKKLDDDLNPVTARATPAWTGDDPAGRTILVHDEQGLGDGIQFIRYAPLLARLGARVLVECCDPLLRLFGTLAGVDGVVGRGDRVDHDAHVSLMSLPHLMGTTSATIPAAIPYLSAEPDLAAIWRQRLAGAPGMRVGLVWAGNPDFKDDRRRSPGLAPMLPLLDVPGVRFFALQKGAGCDDLARYADRLGPQFTDLGPEIRDFADTAGIMVNLDLVISSCTAPPHLAGALGRPVWTILPLNADWRWLESGDRTPWYPTMRLFRRHHGADWGSVIAAVRQALVRAAAEHGSPPGEDRPRAVPT